MSTITKVEDIMNLVTQTAAVVKETDTLDKVLEEMVKDPKTQSVYVVNDRNQLAGIITLNIAIQYLYNEYIPPEYLEFDISVIEGTKVDAKEIMLPPIYVKKSDRISEAFKKMFKYHVNELPVVDDNMYIIGDLNALELVHGWFKKNKLEKH